MSERLPGVPLPPPPPPPRDASVVVLFRRVASGVEVFWLEREQRLQFAGGFYAFAGGKLDEADKLVPVDGASGDAAAFIACAARELFEETGVLKVGGAETLAQIELDELRRAVLAETMSFAQLLSSRGLTLHADDFVPSGRWITPPYLPRGFDARFFLVEMPATQTAFIWKGELTAGEWIAPTEALKRWEKGTALLHPPNLHALQVMSSFVDVASASKQLSNAPYMTDFIAERIEFQRGIMLFPLLTPTLPPATHTNCYLLGTKELLVVDPGSPDVEEVDRLIRFVRALDGMHVKAIVLTHHHGDHTGGAQRLSEQLGVPVWAHERTADRVDVEVTRTLHDGDELVLDGPMPMTWKVLHTPGHARGHVTLIDSATRAAIVGDMVAGVGTIVIDPPEGDMAEYLKQIERLEQLPVSAVYPAHGPVIPDGPGKMREYQMHRAWREQKVFEALQSFDGEVEISKVVERAYDDVASFVWPIAERNTEAILEKLVAEGRAKRNGALVIAARTRS